MSRKTKTKREGVRALLDLLGADPNEPIPQTLAEARELAGVERVERERCPETGKTCFSSESQAAAAINNRLRKGANTGKLRAYRCPDCNQFHMSSSFYR